MAARKEDDTFRNVEAHGAEGSVLELILVGLKRVGTGAVFVLLPLDLAQVHVGVVELGKGATVAAAAAAATCTAVTVAEEEEYERGTLATKFASVGF